MKNKIKLYVGGIEYCFTSDDSDTYVRKLGDELNRRLDKVSKQNSYLSTTMVATLTALEYCDEKIKAIDELNETKLQLKAAKEDAVCARLEADEARREIERQNKDIMQLRAKL